MTPDRELAERISRTDLGSLDDVFRAYLSNQSWYRKHANTIKTAFLGLLSLAGIIVTLGIELPEPAIVGVAVVGLLAQMIGVDDADKAVSKAISSGTAGRHRA